MVTGMCDRLLEAHVAITQFNDQFDTCRDVAEPHLGRHDRDKLWIAFPERERKILKDNWCVIPAPGDTDVWSQAELAHRHEPIAFGIGQAVADDG